jgi:hypothetical protein
MIDATLHFRRWNLFRKIVVLIAVRAGEITATRGNYMRQNGVIRGPYPIEKHPVLARTAVYGKHVSADLFSE